MTGKEYMKCFKAYQDLSHMWQVLLFEIITKLGGVSFENMPHIPLWTSYGTWEVISVKSLSMDEYGYLIITDCDNDIYFKKDLDGDTALLLISEIMEQTDFELDE